MEDDELLEPAWEVLPMGGGTEPILTSTQMAEMEAAMAEMDTLLVNTHDQRLEFVPYQPEPGDEDWID